MKACVHGPEVTCLNCVRFVQSKCPLHGAYEGWVCPDCIRSGNPMKPTPRDSQIGGDHYKKHRIQPWDIIDEYGLGFYDGNVLKYLLRYKDKNGVQDLEKALHYLQKLIEQEKKGDAK